MRNYLLTAVALAAIASPAAARDGQPYFGIEGGALFAKDNDADIFVDYTTTQTPAAPALTGPADAQFDNVVGLDYKRGYDIDLVAGYDFGFVRLEAELGRKRAKLDEFGVDASFITALNTALNRPSAAPDPGAPGQAALTAGNFDRNGSIRVNSIMGNALLDFEVGGFAVYGGVGAGRAFLSFGQNDESAWAYQGIVGARFAVSPSIDLGLKYRYFRTGKVDLSDDTLLLTGNANRTTVGTVNVDQTTNAILFEDFDRKFQSHSLLASLIFNFGGPSAPPPPPPLPPAPPAPVEVAPATQTCADGSVILATDACPAPPPPPLPAPAPERG